MTPEFLQFLAVGFAAQLVDGALGMGYGVISTTVLLATGASPASASAAVHAAKVFTGAASAVSHLAHRNVDWRLLGLLSAGAVFGGVAGAFLTTSIEGDVVKPYVVGWLALMGLVILYRAWKGRRPRPFNWKSPFPLGLVGGFFDAIGGGGWGPVVTSTLMGSGADPRKAIGTTNTAEFVLAVAVSAAFVGALVSGHWRETGLAEYGTAVGGLVVGGLLAAPLAGWTTKVLPTRRLMWAVGALVLALAGYQGFMMIR
jgi:uncharacterized membrane protein YfcA